MREDRTFRRNLPPPAPKKKGGRRKSDKLENNNRIENYNLHIMYEIRSELEHLDWKENLVRMSKHGNSMKHIYVYDITENICYWIYKGKIIEYTVKDYEEGVIEHKRINEKFEERLKLTPFITPSYLEERTSKIEKTDKGGIRLEYNSDDEELVEVEELEEEE